jgi:flagellar hook protein FlgE
MSVIGNNLANVNTHGFKASRVTFVDILSQSLTGGTGEYQIGRGVEMSKVIPQLSQGSFETTTSPTDLAIDGDGFFIVKGDEGKFYTRAGIFIFNKDGEMITPTGYTLQGWKLDREGKISGSLDDINISAISSSPYATTKVELKVNLDADSEPPSDFDWTDPHNTSNYSTTLSIYDSLGRDHMISIFFRKDSENTWNYHVLAADGEINGDTLEVGSGTLTFSSSGALESVEGDEILFDWKGGAEVSRVLFDFGTGLNGTTQFAGNSSTLFQDQDGYASGHLINISVDTEGKVTGLFSNGTSRSIYKIALANFKSPWDLDMVGKNLFAESNTSGQPIIGSPGTSGIGKIVSNSLEMSNVDIATEFVNLIKTQQAFQANSRIITTTDQMLQDIINLKR